MISLKYQTKKIRKYVIDRGNTYAETKLPRYTIHFTDEQYETMYENWLVFVRKTIPEEKLLVFNVKHGIAPLAKERTRLYRC